MRAYCGYKTREMFQVRRTLAKTGFGRRFCGVYVTALREWFSEPLDTVDFAAPKLFKGDCVWRERS